ncbi:hypothetical protein EV193_102506 [Herbihabitans rhizosphaerae]|uniref:Uncharacterized protein n=1 Tax=Herbihabitans rhizosphaerae TaxID=1872711 RepID=A0A4Q7L316_9PSEU|nr:hypothetical protein [Herbihabitans rhizosphaerae]RZS43526.1 hypothetical protein EV193_102506 [Herbihabitans rhizosphaerae]
MTVARAAWRPGRLAVLVLLAALLAALGTSFSLSSPTAAASSEPRDAGLSVDGSALTVVAPVRGVDRLAAEPSTRGVHGSDELSPFGELPNTAPHAALLRLGVQDTGVTPRFRATQRPTAGDRAPPVRLTDQ